MILQPFDPLHQKILLILLSGWVIIPLLGKFSADNFRQLLAFFIGVCIIFQESYLFFYRQYFEIFNPQKHIPIHLCSFSQFIAAYTLFTKSQRGFELAFYWAIAAAIQPILTPELESTSVDTQFVIFFLSHGLIILSIIWLITVEKRKLRSQSLKEVIIITNILLIPIALINWIFGSNYMFLCRKPAVENPLLLGEWPFYLLGFELLGISFFCISFFAMKLFGRIKT